MTAQSAQPAQATDRREKERRAEYYIMLARIAELEGALAEMHDAASARELERSMNKPTVEGLRRFVFACERARAALAK